MQDPVFESRRVKFYLTEHSLYEKQNSIYDSDEFQASHFGSFCPLSYVTLNPPDTLGLNFLDRNENSKYDGTIKTIAIGSFGPWSLSLERYLVCRRGNKAGSPIIAPRRGGRVRVSKFISERTCLLSRKLPRKREPSDWLRPRSFNSGELQLVAGTISRIATGRGGARTFIRVFSAISTEWNRGTIRVRIRTSLRHLISPIFASRSFSFFSTFSAAFSHNAIAASLLRHRYVRNFCQIFSPRLQCRESFDEGRRNYTPTIGFHLLDVI